MPVLMLSFFLGYVAGLRSLAAPAVVCWATYLGWLHLAGGKLAFISSPSTLTLVTLLALAELIIDKLPQTPARTAPFGLIARIVLGALCGMALATSDRVSPSLGALVASAGALVGAFTGYRARHTLVARLRVPGYVVALTEDAIAIIGGLLIVAHS